MSVVINDFEIIPDSSGGETIEEEQSTVESASLRPADVIEIVERKKRRRRRLRAH